VNDETEDTVRAKANALRGRLQGLNPITEQPLYDEMFEELVQVEGKLRRLKEQRRAREKA
jgi:hypothetical protein